MQKDIQKLVEETISSFDGAERAAAAPFLLTRIHARMKRGAGVENIWTKAGSFLSTPRIALTGLALVIILNAAIIIQDADTDADPFQNTTIAKDEFALNVISIYDTENQEP